MIVHDNRESDGLGVTDGTAQACEWSGTRTRQFRFNQENDRYVSRARYGGLRYARCQLKELGIRRPLCSGGDAIPRLCGARACGACAILAGAPKRLVPRGMVKAIITGTRRGRQHGIVDLHPIFTGTVKNCDSRNWRAFGRMQLKCPPSAFVRSSRRRGRLLLWACRCADTGSQTNSWRQCLDATAPAADHAAVNHPFEPVQRWGVSHRGMVPAGRHVEQAFEITTRRFG